MRPSARAAAMIAWIGTRPGGEATGDEIIRALGFSPVALVKAVAAARAQAYITVERPGGKLVAKLTEKARELLEAEAA
jgi:hypothetical protein